MASHSLGNLTEVKVMNSQREKRPLTLDLNYPAPSEDILLNARYTWDISQQGQDGMRGRSEPQPINDCVVLDDEVAIISPRIYAQAKNNSRRNLVVREVPATNIERNNSQSNAVAFTALVPLHCHKRRRTLRNQAVLNWEHHFNEESDKSKSTEVSIPEPPQGTTPPETPSFSCPICLGPFSEATSTKCGHIFCKVCIEASIKVHHKCPTCRQKLRMKGTIRVYLPTK